MTLDETYRLYAEACHIRSYNMSCLPEPVREVLEQINTTYARDVCWFMSTLYDIENLPWGKDSQLKRACFARYVLARRPLSSEARVSLEGFLAFCTL